MLISEEIKSLALAILELCLTEGISWDELKRVPQRQYSLGTSDLLRDFTCQAQIVTPW